MKFCGTDSPTVKAASKEDTFLIQILSSSGVISNLHEAQIVFSVSPDHGPCLSAVTRQKDFVWCLLGCLWSQMLHDNSTLLEKFAVVYAGK